MTEMPYERIEGAQPMPNRYSLPDRLDTATAPGLADALRGRAGTALALEGAAVQTVGALGIQVLVAAARQWHQDGQAFCLENPSDALLEGCRWLGVAPADIGCDDQEQDLP